MESFNPDRSGGQSKLSSYQRSELTTMTNKKLESLNITHQDHFPIVINLLKKLLEEEEYGSFDEIKKIVPNDSNFDLYHIESIYEDLADPTLYAISPPNFEEYRNLIKSRIAAVLKKLSDLTEAERKDYISEQMNFLAQKKTGQAKVKDISNNMMEKLLNQINDAINGILKEYLETDNPQRTKLLQAVTSLLGKGGNEGRQRAFKYKDTILAYKNSATSAGEFITKIILDVLNENKNSPLGVSTVLRNKISNLIRPYVHEALLFNNIDEFDVLREANSIATRRATANYHRHARYSGYISSGPDHVTSDDKIDAAMKLIFHKAVNNRPTTRG